VSQSATFTEILFAFLSNTHRCMFVQALQHPNYNTRSIASELSDCNQRAEFIRKNKVDNQRL